MENFHYKKKETIANIIYIYILKKKKKKKKKINSLFKIYINICLMIYFKFNIKHWNVI